MILALAVAAAMSMPPVEECGGDPAFDQVRAKFIAAVKGRDVGVLAGIAADDVGLDDIGEDKGVARMRDMMSGEQGADFWRMLEPAADGGCSGGAGGRILPSYATRLTGEEMVVAAAREPIRAGPSAEARVKGFALYEWVALNFADSGPFYWHVKLRSGRIGYIRSERIYSNISPYAAFERQGRQWRMTKLRLVPAD